tara:strand:+ start:3412 stop:4833 length:1422 start_codon:yes stop_codon:yes gene_type:complete
MNYKAILFFLGIYSLFITFFSFLNILYSIYFNFILDLNSYLITLIISLLIGVLFFFIGLQHNKNISINGQIIFIILSYLFLPLLISIPYFLSSYNVSFLNSYFESVSGFTTTGFSIIENTKDIDEPLLMWRSSSQWLGGLFFLVAVIGTLGSKQVKIKPVYLISANTTEGNFYNNFNYNFIKILMIYFISTIFVIFLYSLFDIRLLNSFHLAMTTISSGGFLPSNNLSNIITSDWQILILTLTLLFPIFNFYLLFKVFSQQFKIRDSQEDFHLAVIIFALTLLFYFFIIPDEGIVDVFFAIVTSLATSGIAIYSSDIDISLFCILLTIIGGSLLSTSSGIKYVRFYILLKISYQEIYKLVKPINIFNNNLFNSETKIDDQDIKISFLVFISFILSIFVLSSILTLDALNFEESFKLSILTLTNTTNSALYGLESINFYAFNNFTKLIIIIFMILAKIEIIAVLLLIKKYLFKE